MHLKVLLPFQVFSDKTNVTHIVVEMRDTLAFCVSHAFHAPQDF